MSNPDPPSRLLGDLAACGLDESFFQVDSRALQAKARARMSPDLRARARPSDVSQETIASVLATRAKAGAPADPEKRPPLSVALNSTMANMQRRFRAKKRGNGAHEFDLHDHDVPCGPPGGPLDDLVREENEALVRRELAKLDERSQRLVQLWAEGRTWEEVAARIGNGSSQEAARKACGRALKTLKERLHEKATVQ